MNNYTPSYTKGYCKDCLNLGTIKCLATGWNEEGKPVDNNGEIHKCKNSNIIIGVNLYENFCTEEYENDNNWNDLLTQEIPKCNCYQCNCNEKEINKTDLINEINETFDLMLDYNIDHFQNQETRLLVTTLVEEIKTAVNKTIENIKNIDVEDL